MWEAVVFGFLASSALVIGGAIGSFWRPSDLVTGAMLAFASGTLMPEAFERGRPVNAFATAAGFYVAFVLAEGW
jgi:hypothetical protein